MNRFTALRLAGNQFEAGSLHATLAHLSSDLHQDLVVALNGPERPFRVRAEHDHTHRAVQSWLKDRLLPSRVLLCMECPVAGLNGRLVLAESEDVGLVLFFAAVEVVDSLQEEQSGRLSRIPCLPLVVSEEPGGTTDFEGSNVETRANSRRTPRLD